MEEASVLSICSAKNEIRRRILGKRNALSASEVLKRSLVIQHRVMDLSQYKSAKIIGAYFPIGSEVRTEYLIESALNSQKVVLLPKVASNNITLSRVFKADIRDNKLVEGRFRILEPPRSSWYNAQKNIDLLIVPGIAFDKYGNRIGYGRGYYDRFIKQKDFRLSIGLAFQFQVLDDALPRCDFDQKLHAIATERNVLVC
jgi:5-formyltetrahydrofolate cyclo-ligase